MVAQSPQITPGGTMAPNRALALALSIFTLAISGCKKIKVEMQKKSELTNLLDSWIDKPIQEFLNQTKLAPTSEFTWKDSGRKQLEFNTLSGILENSPGGTINYVNHVNGFPAPELNPRNGKITIPGHGSGSQTGCKLRIIINNDGKIRSWNMQGGECFIETFNCLKIE